MALAGHRGNVHNVRQRQLYQGSVGRVVESFEIV